MTAPALPGPSPTSNLRPRSTAVVTGGPALAESSPTTTLRRLLLTGFVALLLALIFGARGVVHAGQSMSDGPMRTVTLDVGQTVLDWTEAVHLNWPWDQLETALGNKPQPAVPPLLATGLPPGPKPPGFVPSGGLKGVVVTGPSAVARNQRTHRYHGPPQPASTGRPVRHITPQAPLRLLVTGDSLSGYLAPELINEMAKVGPVVGFADTHNGTGITRPDFVDWSIVAQQQVAADNPDAVVVIMGGNDFQNMTLPNGKFFQASTPAWTREYQRRVEIVMRIWARNGTRRVYWLSIPPARDPTWADADAHINIALQRAAAQVPGARYVNILGPVTNHGHYADFVNVGGQPTLIREQDGVHLNLEGSTIVAHEMVPILRHDWFPPVPVHHHHPIKKPRDKK